MEQNTTLDYARFPLSAVLSGWPDAEAEMTGSAAYPRISGRIRFYQTTRGVLVYAKICGLPSGNTGCNGQIFGFHIHGGTACAGEGADPFAAAGSHYDSRGCPHPSHAGDLPPLFGNDGLAVSAFLTDRFTVDEILGKAVIIHEGPDDFTSQPAGNAGDKIACGVIEKRASPAVLI